MRALALNVARALNGGKVANSLASSYKEKTLALLISTLGCEIWTCTLVVKEESFSIS
jgi:hypothetical protein